jgi:hypothetical protein
MAQRTPDWRDKFRVLAQISFTKHPAMPDIPLVTEFLKPEYLAPGVTLDEAKTFWDLMLTQKVMGRPYAVGPGVPPDRVEALRAAFHATVADGQFKSDAERSRSEILAVDGRDIQDMIAKVASAPPAVIAKLNEAIKYKGEVGEAKGASEPKPNR